MGNSRRRKKPQRKINHQMRGKLAGLFGAVLLALVCLLGRITYINATSGNKYKKQVLTQAQQKYASNVLPAKRGNIYDRNGNILATSNKVYNVILDCKTVNSDEDYAEPTIRALNKILGVEEEKVRSLLSDEKTSSSQYQILIKKLSMDDKKKFEKYCTVDEDSDLSESEIKERSNVKGVWFEEDYLRSYPFNSLACDAIGFTLARDVADVGLESYYNSTLMGADGRQYGYFNSDSDVEQTIIEPVDGKSIVTTIDVGMQQIVEKYVNGFKKKMGAKDIGVIIEDPNTGEILAMDAGDRYDLNNPRDLSSIYSEEEIKAMNDTETVQELNDMWNNFCVTDAYEPGSVIKPIVVAGALEKGGISETDTFLCDGGEAFGANGDPFIKCAVYPDAHGEQDLTHVIANSCNDGMMAIAAAMGADEFIKAQSLFNFGSRTGIDLPNEGYGIIHTAETMGATELACSAFGQGITCTMIQEINAMCSVINGGYYYQPHLVKEIQDGSGSTVKTIDPILLKQTISSDISADIRSYMAASVTEGTSRTSKVQGYSSGGKTGTAEKLPRGNGKYLVSFITFAPVEEPQLVLYVVVDEPNAENQADSKYPQYIAQGILSELLPYMNIEPDEAENGAVPETELWEGFEGVLEDISGGSVDEAGNLVDAEGNLIDMEGNRVDEEGYLLNEEGQRKVDENGEYIKSQNMETFSGETLPSAESGESVGDAVSNPAAPAPPESDEDPVDGNNMESEGLTNEEAGLE
ncbi:MAG: penicillin-binding transpeptidase domain-containing protein [Blautia sp.]|uniref:penicillin-binding transpeptidase domain-containing protein n=1 Tax=Blautia sp. TaxID=1955243 RepID=UPI002A7493A9|nr:penicillin-binding transpeptidase domain-containing protein [Blautia sp.]MDY3016112.1 penicillin-binding transpeptidase domain-containing protein [Blautia sp.]